MINKRIREILELFSNNSYIGYTATPFANIFIDPDSDDEMYGKDLFPRDFIVGLELLQIILVPKVFLMTEIPMIKIAMLMNSLPIWDNEDYIPIKHKIDFQPLIPLTKKGN